MPQTEEMTFLKFIYHFSRCLISVIIRGVFLQKNISCLPSDSSSCAILGNGPSLSEQLDSSDYFLHQANLMVVNNFALSEHYTALKPNYYVFADPCYWDASMYHEEYLKSQQVLQQIAEKTTWSLCLIAPRYAKAHFENVFSNHAHIKFLFVNTYILAPTYPLWVYPLYKKLYACPHYQNVLVLASFVAINFGFKQIHLFGAEHSWTENIRVNDLNQVCLADKHFYNLEASLTPWIKVDGNPYKMHEVLTDLSLMFRGYYDIQAYAQYKGSKIYNSTPNSYIDAFERMTI